MSSSNIAANHDSASLLGRCSPSTRAAAKAFPDRRPPEEVARVIDEVITHYVDEDKRDLLDGSVNELRLAEDLGIDSLSMIEIVMTLEEAFDAQIEDNQVRNLRTVGDIKDFANARFAA